MGPAEWGTCIHSLSYSSSTLACRNNTIAVCGSIDGKLTLFDATTGSQSAALSGRTDHVHAVSFSFDGTFLVSGGSDGTIKLWDIQTGGIIKEVNVHMPGGSVSISADNTVIASSTANRSIYLWGTGTDECGIIHSGSVHTIAFSPTNPQLLLSVSVGNIVQQLETSGNCIGPPITGSHAAFSLDGTKIVSCYQGNVIIINIDHGEVVAEFQSPGPEEDLRSCCFSPDGNLVAASSNYIIYLWNITCPNPLLINTFIGHIGHISSLVFSSSFTLISTSMDNSIKFWEVPCFLGTVASEAESMPLIQTKARAVSLQTKDNLAFSIDSTGEVNIWNIITGHCKESISTQATGVTYADMQVISGRLIVVWVWDYEHKIFIWDAGKVRRIEMDRAGADTWSLRISEDGSSIFHLYQKVALCVQKLSLQTGNLVEERKLEPNSPKKKALINCTHKLELLAHGWDFETSTDRLYLDMIFVTEKKHKLCIMSSATGKEIFVLCDRYAHPSCTQWDGQYLITGYNSGDILILDFSHMTS